MGFDGPRPDDPVPIRDASTVIVLRDAATRPRVLMGQRGKWAAFMPSKFVFPGGAVDAVDATIPLARPPSEACATRLGDSAPALVAGAVRELWEETGLLLGAGCPRSDVEARTAGADIWPPATCPTPPRWNLSSAPSRRPAGRAASMRGSFWWTLGRSPQTPMTSRVQRMS